VQYFSLEPIIKQQDGFRGS